MRISARFVAFILSLLMLFSAFFAIAEETSDVPEETEETEETEEDTSLTDEDELEEVEVVSTDAASIEGLTPLYTTTIKAFVKTGKSIRMRTLQDLESEVVCTIAVGETITVYKVYPSFVLAEYNGNVGYVVRTWVNEYMTTLDAEKTPPYGVVPMKYVATLTAKAEVHVSPDLNSAVQPIAPNTGSKISIIDFENGFAKVLYWRSYGYIDATLLTDLVVVSPTEEPMSEDTPIAAFCSFFAYNTGSDQNTGRCKNIVRSCQSMTRVMQPGEELNFNDDVGPWKVSNGYFSAPVLIGGKSQPGTGGGTCQSSSTLYNAVRQLSGITIIKRRPHGPGCAKYLPMHQDAAVGNDNLNFIFRNDYDFPIRILAESTGEGTVCIQVFKGE